VEKHPRPISLNNPVEHTFVGEASVEESAGSQSSVEELIADGTATHERGAEMAAGDEGCLERKGVEEEESVEEEGETCPSNSHNLSIKPWQRYMAACSTDNH
jgi:hypothetical protein